MIACPACQHLNGVGAATCFRCGRPFSGALSSDPPETSFVQLTDGTMSGLTGGVSPGPVSGFLMPGQNFGARYHIIRQLGAGGMGAVYQAWDSELGVGVALKIIRAAAADADSAVDLERRFKREILLARQVTHRNVVRIHDLGEIDGIKYITMPFIDGADLSQVLRKSGRLPVARVLAIARQIASGLEAAHEVGVVHRDLKPANIMLEGDEHALIMDFGIARSVSAGATVATMAGAVIGTFEYMSPEQARGQTADHRADIYAFGMILYDMLLGARPQSATPLGALMDRMRNSPPSPRSIDPTVPEDLDRIIVRCLQVDPAARYATTADLVTDLAAVGTGQPAVTSRPRQPVAEWAWVSAAVLTVAATVGAAWWVSWEPRPASEATSRAGIAVPLLIADFVNETGDPVFEGALEQVLALGVEGASFVTSYSRPAAQRLVAQIVQGGKLDVEGARLVSVREGIKLVLAGSIAEEHGTYRLSLRALDAVTGAEVTKAMATARTKQAVLEAVQDLATDVRRGLGDADLDDAAAKRETFTAGSLEAARAYAQAQDLSSNGREKEAAALFEQAVAHDPNFGRAYASWAVSVYRLGDRDEAEQLWKKALSLIDRMSERERYRTLGSYYFGVSRNYDIAVENYEALLKRYPADASGLNNLGIAYFETLNFPKAVEQGRRVVAVYPKNAVYRQNLALYLMYSGDHVAAAREAEQVVAQTTALPKAYLPAAIAALAAGRADEARDAYRRMSGSGPRGAQLAALGLADMALLAGEPQEAEEILRRRLAGTDRGSKRDQALTTVLMAETYAANGRLREAVAASRAALALGDFDDVVVPAATLLIEANQDREAQATADNMERQLQKRARAFGKLLKAELALKRNRVAEAVDSLNEAKALADLWIVRMALGRAYVAAGRHAEALTELDACVRRTGEASAVFLTDVPSYRVTVSLKYWLARAQDGLGLKAEALANYKAFLARRGETASDAITLDARKRSGGA
jgi:tetratricopeptide (TPR) repeat protein